MHLLLLLLIVSTESAYYSETFIGNGRKIAPSISKNADPLQTSFTLITKIAMYNRTLYFADHCRVKYMNLEENKVQTLLGSNDCVLRTGATPSIGANIGKLVAGPRSLFIMTTDSSPDASRVYEYSFATGILTEVLNVDICNRCFIRSIVWNPIENSLMYATNTQIRFFNHSIFATVGQACKLHFSDQSLLSALCQNPARLMLFNFPSNIPYSSVQIPEISNKDNVELAYLSKSSSFLYSDYNVINENTGNVTNEMVGLFGRPCASGNVDGEESVDSCLDRLVSFVYDSISDSIFVSKRTTILKICKLCRRKTVQYRDGIIDFVAGSNFRSAYFSIDIEVPVSTPMQWGDIDKIESPFLIAISIEKNMVFVADIGGEVIRQIDQRSGLIKSIAGKGINGISLKEMSGITYAFEYYLFICDKSYGLLRFDVTTSRSSVIQRNGMISCSAIESSNHFLYYYDQTENCFYKYNNFVFEPAFGKCKMFLANESLFTVGSALDVVLDNTTSKVTTAGNAGAMIYASGPYLYYRENGQYKKINYGQTILDVVADDINNATYILFDNSSIIEVHTRQVLVVSNQNIITDISLGKSIKNYSTRKILSNLGHNAQERALYFVDSIYRLLVVCRAGYSGHNCSVPVCYGTPGYSPLVCNGRGMCTRPDDCTCNNGAVGQQCENCAPGLYINDNGLCDSCADGKYIIRSQCVNCPAGGFSNQFTKLSDKNKCFSCFPGTYVSNEGAESCKMCPTGTSSSQFGSSSCDQCKNASNCPFGSIFGARNNISVNFIDPFYLISEESQSKGSTIGVILQIAFLGVGGVLGVLVVSIIFIAVCVNKEFLNNSKIVWIKDKLDMYSTSHPTKQGEPIVSRPAWSGVLATIGFIIIAIFVPFAILGRVLPDNIAYQISLMPFQNLEPELKSAQIFSNFTFVITTYEHIGFCEMSPFAITGLSDFAGLLQINATETANRTCTITAAIKNGRASFNTGLSLLFHSSSFQAFKYNISVTHYLPNAISEISETIASASRFVPENKMVAKVSIGLIPSYYTSVTSDSFFHEIVDKVKTSITKKSSLLERTTVGYSLSPTSPKIEQSEFVEAYQPYGNNQTLSLGFVMGEQSTVLRVQQVTKTKLLELFSLMYTVIGTVSGVVGIIMVQAENHLPTVQQYSLLVWEKIRKKRNEEESLKNEELNNPLLDQAELQESNSAKASEKEELTTI